MAESRDEISIQPGNARRVQVRAARKDGFGAEKRQVFLDHLAGCCNLGRAAAAAGVSAVTVNYHRRRDPAFAAQCAEALASGYEALEAMLVERAAGAAHVPGADAADAPGPEGMDTALAVHLLQLKTARAAETGRRTGRAGYAPRRATEAELNASILAKLDVLDRRLRRMGPGTGRRGLPK